MELTSSNRSPWLAVLVLAFSVLLPGAGWGQLLLYPEMPDDRAEMVDRHMAEFSSEIPKEATLGQAIREVLMRLPPETLLKLLDRRKPVIFTEMYDSGTAQFASTTEYNLEPQDIPAMQNGVTILKLSSTLNNGSKEAAMGIVAHELAHRALEHVRRGRVTAEAEAEANALVKTWGFEKEYFAASHEFGREQVERPAGRLTKNIPSAMGGVPAESLPILRDIRRLPIFFIQK
jgi:hypothetical protein